MNLINYNLEPEYFRSISIRIEKDYIYDNDYIFVELNNKSVSERLVLRKALNQYPEGHIIIVSDSPLYAELAWQINAFFFLKKTFSTNQINQLIFKMKSKKLEYDKKVKLKLNFQGGFEMLSPSNLSVLKGQGNYCDFYIKDKGKKIFTSRVGKLMKVLEHIPYMLKVNRSLMINLNHLSKIENGLLYFGGNPTYTIPISKAGLVRIKKELFWLNK